KDGAWLAGRAPGLAGPALAAAAVSLSRLRVQPGADPRGRKPAVGAADAAPAAPGAGRRVRGQSVQSALPEQVHAVPGPLAGRGAVPAFAGHGPAAGPGRAAPVFPAARPGVLESRGR